MIDCSLYLGFVFPNQSINGYPPPPLPPSPPSVYNLSIIYYQFKNWSISVKFETIQDQTALAVKVEYSGPCAENHILPQ